MKIKIKRTSIYGFSEDNKPHPDAFISNPPKNDYAWYINISSLKVLFEFIKENGNCVLSEENGEIVLEIYDDYRE